MQEFSSVIASSYDAESLAPLLNEKAADGWSVVSIVAAGTNIVAYLQREADGSAAAPTGSTESTETAGTDVAAGVAAGVAADVTTEPAADEAPAAVSEPAGWASAPEETPADASPAEEAPAADAPAEAETTEPTVDDLAAQVSEPEPTPESEPQPEPEPEAAPAVESAVPAGWYADPSGRFELRYWDGNAWTEHVSRAGQQFTDPPVA